jgi:hypothetical protein
MRCGQIYGELTPSGQVCEHCKEPSISKQRGNLLSSWAAFSLLKTTLRHGVAGNHTEQYSVANPVPEIRSSTVFLNLYYFLVAPFELDLSVWLPPPPTLRRCCYLWIEVTLFLHCWHILEYIYITLIYNIVLFLNILYRYNTVFIYTSKNVLLIIGIIFSVLLGPCMFLNVRLQCGQW